jgi:N-methylhydantoinase A
VSRSREGGTDSSRYRIGVDIGGTFTDFSVVDGAGDVLLWKEDSTPRDPVKAIVHGLDALARLIGLPCDEFLQRVDLCVHGTTIATNVLIERSGARIGLLCTKGFRDILYFRDGFKPERFNVHLPHSQDFVERSMRFGVEERTDQAGSILTPLNEADVVAAANHFKAADVAAIAIAFLWSMVNPVHEDRAAELLRGLLPEIPLVLSKDVLPELGEWERTSATVLSAYVLPRIRRYLAEFEVQVKAKGLQRRPLIMQVNGGCASVDEILRRPVSVIHSGPAAAPVAASFRAAEAGYKDAIAVDMGGTSFDVCLIRESVPEVSRKIQVEDQPIGVPGIEVLSIGAGGGSIAWVDSGGALRVGPRSAGSQPGPACYGLGGTAPTVTDANLVLGYLPTTGLLGGRRSVSYDLAATAVGRDVGDPLGLDETKGAWGIIRVVDSNMVGGIRAVSVARGIDPRRYLLVAGGGAGGLHAVRLARSLGVSHVLIPREASTLCAFGMTITDVRHDYSWHLHRLTTELDPPELDHIFEMLEGDARARLRAEGFEEGHIELQRAVDARYPSQIHELTISLPSQDGYSVEAISKLEQAFHAEHARRFTYAIPELPVECLHWRVAALGRMPLRVVGGVDRISKTRGVAAEACIGHRDAYSARQETRVSVRVYDFERLRAGDTVEGPALLQSAIATIHLDEDDRLETLENGAAFITVFGIGAAEAKAAR